MCPCIISEGLKCGYHMKMDIIEYARTKGIILTERDITLIPSGGG